LLSVTDIANYIIGGVSRLPDKPFPPGNPDQGIIAINQLSFATFSTALRREYYRIPFNKE
jgi:hypothetical protein